MFLRMHTGQVRLQDIPNTCFGLVKNMVSVCHYEAEKNITVQCRQCNFDMEDDSLQHLKVFEKLPSQISYYMI